jgi:hypothetical protein
VYVLVEVTCISEATYPDALTRGKRYKLLALDEAKEQLQLVGDNQRTRWYPVQLFDFENHIVATLQSYTVDDQIIDRNNAVVEVTVKLSTGELRWCIFATPRALTANGGWIPNTKVRWHYGNRHIIIANEITNDLIEIMLNHLDTQNELINCTIPLNP